MAVANTKAVAISNADASPLVLNDVRLERGVVGEAVGTVEVAAADDNNSVYRLFRVHSSWRISQLDIANDAITAGTAFDIGVYDTAAGGGAVVSSQQQLFASAVDLSSAHDFTSYLYEATPTNIDKVEKKLWELMGLTTDPDKFYDIALTGTTVGSAAGTISGRLRYIRN